MHKHFIHAEKQLLVGMGSAATCQPQAESRTGSQGLRTCRKGKAKLKAQEWDPLRVRTHLWPHWVSPELRGFLGTAPGPPAAEGAAPPSQACVAKTKPCNSCLDQLIHQREATHLMDQVRDLVFSPLLSCGLISFFLESRKR